MDEQTVESRLARVETQVRRARRLSFVLAVAVGLLALWGVLRPAPAAAPPRELTLERLVLEDGTWRGELSATTLRLGGEPGARLQGGGRSCSAPRTA